MDENAVILFGSGVQAEVRELATSAAPTPLDRMRVWSEALELWLSSRRADNTQRAYRKSWQLLLSYTDKMPWEIGKADVQRWVDGMRKAGLSDCTIQQRVAAISSFYSFAMDEYTVVTGEGRELPLHEHNPAAARSLRPKVSPYDKAIYLSTQEARALLAAIHRNTTQGLRDYALFLMYLATGRRNSEVRLLTWGDFETNGGRVWYRWAGKGKRGRKECPLRVWMAVQEYLKAVGRLDSMAEGDYVFTALTDRARRLGKVPPSWEPFSQPLSMREVGSLLKKYARRAGLNPAKIHVHTLRHTAAMLRKEAGDDLEAIQSLLEHSSLAITQIYLHKVEGKKDTSWSKVEALLGL